MPCSWSGKERDLGELERGDELLLDLEQPGHCEDRFLTAIWMFLIASCYY